MKRCTRCEWFVSLGATACANCGADPSSWADIAPIDGRYTIESEIGRGAAGVIYRGMDVTLDRPVALKIVDEKRATKEILERFHREARALAAIRSSHVVQIYALGRDAGLSFIAMELVTGEDLFEILSRYRQHGEALPVRRALAIIRQVAGAIDRIHAAGIVHRDVKPENILIEHETGRPVLIDFGLSTRLSTTRRPSVGIGTPHYMAPEQVDLGPETSPSPISARTDVYALACTAFELLTGQPPFDGQQAAVVLVKQVATPAPPASSIRSELAPFDAVLLKALAKEPTARFESAAAFAASLDRAGASWFADSHVSEAPPTESRAAEPNEQVVRVLVVDDDAAFRTYASAAAKKAYGSRLDLQTGASGSEAIGRALLKAPHIILLDYSMPGLDGIETLTRLRDLPGCAEARVIVLSANVLDDQRWRFALLGVSEFFEKPIVFGALVAALQRIDLARGRPNPSE
jgi:CheY-like chemotaxis protein/tRNA A-37 threonylcarbamoyl transferase component Bud32